MSEDTEKVKEDAVLEKVVGFYCPRYNLRIEITHPDSLTDSPTAANYKDRKMVQFLDGLYQTSDPEIIAALDKREDVFRLDDPRVQAHEKLAGEEPEDKAKAMRLLESVADIGAFPKQKANIPGIIPTTRG